MHRLLLFFTLFALPASAQQHLVGGGFTYAYYEVTGSGYRADSTGQLLVNAQYSYFFRDNWRILTSAAGTVDLDTLYLSGGAAYHFRPFIPKVQSPSETIDYKLISNWSPYLGMEFGFTRVQLSLERSNGTQTDAVIGALIGPTMRGGTIYSINSEWAINVDLALSYSFSPEVASSSRNFSISAVYLLP